MNHKFAALLIGLCASVASAVAQDYSLTNHNIVPFSINPAQAGNANAIRLGLDFRQQWPTLDNHYTTVRLSYDQNFYKRMCSLGAFYTYDDMAAGVFRTNELGLVYAHTLELSDNCFLRLGLQGSYFLNYFDYDKLQYGDQYDEATGRIDANTVENFDSNTRQLFDFSAGAVFNVENVFSLGGAVYHIAEPDNGFVRKSENSLTRKFVVHGNYMHNLRYSNGLWSRRELSDNYMFFNANYQLQGDFQQAYLGAGAFVAPLILGVAEKSDLDQVYVTAFMLGATYKGLQVYYVYDLFTGSRENGSWSHELSLIYIIQKKERFPCPITYW
jgi:type IX secretion system PorP/SprF family membrane protein